MDMTSNGKERDQDGDRGYGEEEGTTSWHAWKNWAEEKERTRRGMNVEGARRGIDGPAYTDGPANLIIEWADGPKFHKV